MKVKEAIAQLKSDIHTLETVIPATEKLEQLLLRKRHLEARKLILKTYESIDPEAEILVADVNLLITLN